MLNMNFRANATTIEALNDNSFADAIRFEYLDMEITLLSGKLVSLQKKLASAGKEGSKKTAEQIQAIRDDIREIEAMIKDCNVASAAVQENHDMVVLSMERSGCKYSNIRNVLRIVAATENSSLFVYALNFKGQEASLESLHKIMDTIHILTESNEVGQSKVKKAEYESACNELNKFVLFNFSLDADTKWTVKRSVRLNKTDLKAFHESYVKNANYAFKTNKKTGETVCEGMKYTTLVVEKTSKKLGTTIDYSKLAAWVCQNIAGKLAK